MNKIKLKINALNYLVWLCTLAHFFFLQYEFSKFCIAERTYKI